MTSICCVYDAGGSCENHQYETGDEGRDKVLLRKRTEMLKLFCVTGYKTHENNPIIKGRKVREMILEEAKDVDHLDVLRLQAAIKLLTPLVEDVYRINAVVDAAKEYHETLKALNSDNVEQMLIADRRFRAYVLEFDMFLDYWQSNIAHHKRIDGTSSDALVANYKTLYRILTTTAYDNHVEYQLLDLIRNHTAHVQSPVNRIQVGNCGNEAFASRDVLLSKCTSGENKKNILKAQPDEIVLSPIVDVTKSCLEDIHAGLIDYQIDELVEVECGIIAGFISYAISKGHLYEPWILMEEDGQRPYHIRDMRAYGYLLERLSKIQDQDQRN